MNKFCAFTNAFIFNNERFIYKYLNTEKIFR